MKKEDAFDMGQPSVCNYFQGHFKLEKAHECGTAHCFAGWYLVAKHFTDIKNGNDFFGVNIQSVLSIILVE